MAYQNLMAGLGALCSYPLGSSSELLSWHQWQELLLSSLQILQTPAYPGRSLVELHRPEKIIGAQYPYVFVLDTVDGQLPQPINDDVVLDFYEGKQLKRFGWHWPLAEEKALTARFTFAVLQQMATTELSFSYSKVAFQGGKYLATAPSPYLTALNLIAQEPPPMALASKPLARQWYLRQSQVMDDPVLDKAIANHRIEVNRYGGKHFDQYDGIVGEPFDYHHHRFSVTQLTQLGQCGFKWFAARLLKLGAIEEEDREINPLTKGNLYHRVAELAIKAYQRDPNLTLDDESLITLWFNQGEQELELGRLPGWHHQRREHLRVLQRVFRDNTFLPHHRADLTAIQVEAKLEGQWHGLTITSRIDRLELTPEGWSVMDYKSGSSVPDGIKNEAGQTKLDLQLAVYQAIVEQHVGPDLVHKTSYYSFAKAQELKSKAAAPEELRAAIEHLKSHLNSGCYPVWPDQEQNACRYCDFGSLCRKSDRVYSKQIA
ncbi:MAG: PD-(D/E)XK nuclease family protein [Synechococcaceae cyanobacterium RL_1_2]|nr:PD-(D/E)XK nuclease family protein [Synechococcaceae cyanobacterium RL_1_2]